MHLFSLILIVSMSMAFALPAAAPLDQFENQREQQQQQAQLLEVADLGGQHAEDGSRQARWLWGGWGVGWEPWSYRYYSYRPYYWW